MWNWRSRSEQVIEEVDSHVSLEMKRLVEEEGLSFKEARAQALRAFGNVTTVQVRFYESQRIMWLDDLRRDMVMALRSFRRNPAFAAIAALTLALGIGVNAAIFTVVNAMLLKPLPYLEPDRLVRIGEITPASATPDGRERRSGAISVAELLEMRSRVKTVSHVSFSGGPALMTFSGRAESMRLQGQRVAPEIFQMLGVRPLLGRGFGTSEEQPGGDTTVVLSFDAWRRHFGGGRDIIDTRGTPGGPVARHQRDQREEQPVVAHECGLARQRHLRFDQIDQRLGA